MNFIIFSFYFLIFISTFNLKVSCFIIIPFNTYENNNKGISQQFNITEFYNDNFFNNLFTKIEIGTPKKYLYLKVSTTFYGLMIGYLCEQNLESSFNKEDSSSFYKNPKGAITYPQYEGGYFAQDSLSFSTNLDFNNNNNQITLNNISFIYMPKYDENKDKNMCGKIGLSLKYYNYVERDHNIIDYFNKKDIIHSYSYSIHYKNNNEGYIIIGEEPHVVLPNYFNENNLRRSNALSEGYDSIEWETEFTQIYFYINGEKKKITEAKKGKFAIENNYIVGTDNYKNKIEEFFFGKYLEKNICHYEKVEKKRFSALICNKDSSFDINSFPNIYFYHRIFNYTFELTKDELFLQKNDKYVFLVFFSDYNIQYFSLGKIFLKKYLFVFNQDTKTIGFYNANLQNDIYIEKISSFTIIIGILFIIICCAMCFFLAKKIYEETRRRRINEINEQYEDNSYENNDINYESNKNKIFLEMPSK